MNLDFTLNTINPSVADPIANAELSLSNVVSGLFFSKDSFYLGVNDYTENNPATLVKDGNEKVGAKGLTTGVNYNITWNPSTNQIGWSLACTPPSISSHPSTSDATYCLNATATALSVTASGTATLSYQWKQCSTSGGTYTDISGATGSSYTPSTATAGTTYYKCYVSNSCGNATSNASGAITVNAAASAATGSATNINASGASLAGTFTAGETSVTEAGFAISKTSGSGYTNYKGTISSTNVTLDKTGLDANTTYYYKTYVTDGCGTYYGSEQTFKTTCTATKPTVVTVTASGVGNDVATVGCNVTNAGVKADCSVETITARGIEWTQGKSGQESIGSGTGSSTKQITGLTPGTEYKYKAFATNASGTSYGEVKSFTTLGVHGDITGLPASPVAKCSGETLQLAPQCSTATSWSYNSDATGVATVSSTGLIEAVGAGSAVITVTAKADNYIDKSVQITVNVSASPAVSASPDNTTAYEVITLTSTSGSVTWSKSDAAAYFVKDNKAVDDDTVVAESVNFKAPAKDGEYIVGATSNGCTSNLRITISTPTEVCN